MRRLRTAATPFGWCVCVALVGCNYDNPGFKVKGSADGSGASETSVSGVTGDTGVSSTPTTGATTGESTSTSVTSAGSASSEPGTMTASDTDVTSTTGDPLGNDCMVPDVVEMVSKEDTFLVARTTGDVVACGFLDEIAFGMFDPNAGYCENFNLGNVAELPLVDVPNLEGRDAVHYLVQFDLSMLLDKNTQLPVQFAQITGAVLEVRAKRLGEVVEVGAYPLASDESWVPGDEHGPAKAGDPSYRCRKAPGLVNQEGPCLENATWFYGDPIHVEASWTRNALTDTIPEGGTGWLQFKFMPSDFGLQQDFFDAANHHGFFLGLAPRDENSTPDKVRILAFEGGGGSVFRVSYCPAGG